jgi:uncharacterized protein
MAFEYLGQGVQYPLSLTNGRVDLVSTTDLIEQSIRDILSTHYGTRFFLPEYGSRLEELLFIPNDDALLVLARRFCIDALEKWEKRIRVADVESRSEPDKIELVINYQIKGQSEVNTFIYPFYKNLQY